MKCYEGGVSSADGGCSWSPMSDLEVRKAVGKERRRCCCRSDVIFLSSSLYIVIFYHLV